MTQEDQQNENIFDTDPLDSSKNALLEISKWTRLISVIGFAIGAFIVAIMLFNGAQILKEAAVSFPLPFAGVYPALVVVFFTLFFVTALVLYYLYKASQLLAQGVQQSDPALLSQAFIYLKNFFIAVVVFAGLQLAGNLQHLL